MPFSHYLVISSHLPAHQTTASHIRTPWGCEGGRAWKRQQEPQKGFAYFTTYCTGQAFPSHQLGTINTKAHLPGSFISDTLRWQPKATGEPPASDSEDFFSPSLLIFKFILLPFLASCSFVSVIRLNVTTLDF